MSTLSGSKHKDGWGISVGTVSALVGAVALGVLIIAANAAGIMPLGFIDSVAGFGDWEKFRAMVRRSRDFGFMGAGCIHPGQVGIVNEEYKPGAAEVEFARRIIALDRDAECTAADQLLCWRWRRRDGRQIIKISRRLEQYRSIAQRRDRSL